MKQVLILCGLFLMMTGCKNDSKQTETSAPDTSRTTAELIAEAHGINHWNKVSKIEFTFSVDRDTIKGPGRAWTWLPKEDSVILRMPDQTLKYSQKAIDSAYISADRAFINDKFWLLIPFQLIWDKSASISDPVSEAAPISGTLMNKITITYPNEGGGYTPGDAYDIFYKDDYLIREWIFRKGNSPEPTLATTFEDYADYSGLKLALSHKREEPSWNLVFRDVRVTTE
jgi:hypothetical protein